MTNMLDKIKYYWDKTNRWHRGLLLLLIVEFKLIPGGKVGFECNDPALSHPFTGDTISWKWLLAITIFLPFLVMLLVEKKYHSSEAQPSTKQATAWYKEYLFGLLINIVTVQLMKILVGSPRPHFFDTCRPIEAETCQGSEYVARYTCTRAGWVTRSDQSFPSGHTSLALHAGLFLAYYLRRRCAARAAAALGALSAAAAALCAASRLLDRRHHARDLLGGGAVGGVVLAYTIFVLCKDFATTSKTAVQAKGSDGNSPAPKPSVDAES